ncbi:MAG: GumC family protein [Syntrophobacteraceae bacterium]
MEKEDRYLERQTQSSLRDFLFILFDRSNVVFSVFLVVFLVTAVIAVLLPPVYRSSASFSLTIPQSLDPLQRETFYDYKNRMARYMLDQKELILSHRVLSKVVQKVNPDTSADRLPKAIVKMMEDVEVTPPGGETFEGSNVFYVSFKDSNAKTALEVTTAISDAYLGSYTELSKSKTDYSYEFFKQQVDGLYQDMVDKEKKLREYETTQALALVEILNLESGKTNIEVGANALLTQSLRKYYDMQEELVSARSLIEALDKELLTKSIPVIPTQMDSPGKAITAYRNKVAQLQIQLNEMKPQFTKDFDPMVRVEKELTLNVKSLKEEMERVSRAQKITASTIEARMTELEKVIEQLEEQIRTTAKQKAEYLHLKQEYTIAKDAYAQGRAQLEQARMASALNQEKQYLTLVDRPQMPVKPFKPNRILIIVLGFAAGIVMGVASALTLDYLDHTIKKPADIERYLKLRYFGSVPRVG